MLATLVEGDPNAPFSIATTYIKIMSVKQGGIKFFESLIWLDLR